MRIALACALGLALVACGRSETTDRRRPSRPTHRRASAPSSSATRSAPTSASPRSRHRLRTRRHDLRLDRHRGQRTLAHPRGALDVRGRPAREREPRDDRAERLRHDRVPHREARRLPGRPLQGGDHRRRRAGRDARVRGALAMALERSRHPGSERAHRRRDRRQQRHRLGDGACARREGRARDRSPAATKTRGATPSSASGSGRRTRRSVSSRSTWPRWRRCAPSPTRSAPPRRASICS